MKESMRTQNTTSTTATTTTTTITSKGIKKKPRGKRDVNLVSPFRRIEAIKGIDWIKNEFEKKLSTAKTVVRHVDITELNSISSPDLMKMKTAPKVVEAPKCECKILDKDAKQNEYPTIKVRLNSQEAKRELGKKFGDAQLCRNQESIPLDLHRLAALRNLNWNFPTTLGKDPVAIHRCHNKNCFNPEHVYFGTKEINNSTEFCQAYVLVNNVILVCCTHQPNCLIPGKRSKLKFQ